MNTLLFSLAIIGSPTAEIHSPLEYLPNIIARGQCDPARRRHDPNRQYSREHVQSIIAAKNYWEDAKNEAYSMAWSIDYDNIYNAFLLTEKTLGNDISLRHIELVRNLLYKANVERHAEWDEIANCLDWSAFHFEIADHYLELMGR